MKIQNIRFSNLYSYAYCGIPLDNYNIVVGPNASGKTNIIRVLKLLLEGNIYANLENVTIKNELRFNPTNDSWINIDVEFSDEEARLLAQFILLKTIKPDDKVVETLRSGSIIIGWSRTPDLDNIKPDLLAIRFANGFTLYQNGNYPLHLTYATQLPNDVSDFRKMLAAIKDVKDRTLADEFSGIHGYVYNDVRQKDELASALLDPSKLMNLFSIKGETITIETGKELKYAPNWNHLVELYSFVYPGTDRRDYNFDFWLFIRRILRNSIVFVAEIRPTYKDLAQTLFLIRTRAEFKKEYQELKNKFKEIFVGIDFDVFEREITKAQIGFSDKEQEKPQTEKYVEIFHIKNGKKFRLEDSASGYFEVLYILSQIANRRNCVLVLDEPALHLHPTKITLLSRILTETDTNQIIIITHSPKFISQKILEVGKGRRLVYVKRENDISKAISPTKSFSKIKKHEFKGEAFFANCNILVEGPADHATLIATSELLGDLFTRYDIEVINVDGKESFEKWFDMLDAFSIPWITMADQDFKPNVGYEQRVIRLNGKLEDLFRKLGWNGGGKITSTQAYDFIIQIKDEKQQKQLFATEIGDVIVSSLRQIGVRPSEALKGYEKFFANRAL